MRDGHRDKVAAAEAAATGSTGTAGAYELVAGGGAPAGEKASEAATGLLASTGAKVGPALAAPRPPWFRAWWKPLTLVLGLKGAFAAVGLVAVVGVVATVALVPGIGDKAESTDDVAAVGPGGGDKDDEESGLQPGGGDKDEPTMASSTTTLPPTTTADGSPSVEPGDPVVTQPDDPPATVPPRAPTTTQPPGPPVDILRFSVAFDQSGQIRCLGNTYAMKFTWATLNATAATLGPTDGRASFSGGASSSLVACGYMEEGWQLTATGAGAADSAQVTTPYFG